MKKLIKLTISRGKPALAVLALATLSFFSVFPVLEVQAQLTNVDTVDEVVCDVIKPIADVMFNFLLIISVIMVIWAAYQYLTAGGDAEKVKGATRTITYAAVAVVVTLLAGAFPDIIASIFGGGLAQLC